MDGSIALVEFSKPSQRACVKTFDYAHIEVELKIWFPRRLAAVDVAPLAYVPLCNSTDTWRSVLRIVPDEGSVFNTKERCPCLVYFETAQEPGLEGLDVANRAAKESEIPNFKGSVLGRFPLVSADFWTSDHLLERSRSVDAFSGTRARGTLTLKRR